MATHRDTFAPDCQVQLEPHRHDELHPELDDWRLNVGAPVAIDNDVDPADRLAGVDVLSWNMAIGLGRLDAVLERLRAGPDGGLGISAARPLVLLLQEAYRSDESVPDSTGTHHHGGRLSTAPGRTDIISLAHDHGLSLRYSPSMRNGRHPSDRGNAVLSTVRLADARAFLLPYIRQRRVAVRARLAGHPELAFVSAHLDTHGQPRTGTRPRRFGAGRTLQARVLAATLATSGGSAVVGADLNTVLGMSDPAVRELVAAGLHPARRVGNWRHTFRRFRLLLDHVLYYSPDGFIAHAEVTRLDDAAAQRSNAVFGSDHHPLLARIELNHR
jgi:endonuclease/exonuclease/phosphatase family metal-dependent hydrolase